MKQILLFFFFLNLTGCYTIHFIKDNNYPTGEYTYTFWHHIGLLGLLEFSQPVDLKSICGNVNQWKSVRVQTGFLQGLVKTITVPVGVHYDANLNINVPYGPSLSTFYSPEQVSISCEMNYDEMDSFQ